MKALSQATTEKPLPESQASISQVCVDLIPAALLSRMMLIVLTLALPYWRRFTGTPALILHSGSMNTGTILDAWDRWDVRWYENLSYLGYNLRGPDGYKNVAFFPLYPLLTRSLHDAMAIVAHNVLGIIPSGSLYPPYLVSAMIVSSACSIAALVYLYLLVRIDFGRRTARRAVTLLALTPLSLFFTAAYSEGTFLLCSIALFYSLRLHRWWQAGLWGLLATATRPPGAVLLAPFILAWVEAHPTVARHWGRRLQLTGRAIMSSARQWFGRWRRSSPQQLHPAPLQLAGYVTQTRSVTSFDQRSERRQRLSWSDDMRFAARNALPVIAIPVGLVLFMTFLYVVFGDALWFSRAQQAWWRTFAPPWQTVVISVLWPLGDLIGRHWTLSDITAVHDLVYELVGLWLTWQAWKRVPRIQGLYMWLLWLVFLTSPAMLVERATGEPHRDVLMSLPRMLLILFPLFTYLAMQERLYKWILLLGIIGTITYTSIFLTGGWVA